MIKVGITGESGFIGYHLYQTLALYSTKFDLITFKREYFNNTNKLKKLLLKLPLIKKDINGADSFDYYKP